MYLSKNVVTASYTLLITSSINFEYVFSRKNYKLQYSAECGAKMLSKPNMFLLTPAHLASPWWIIYVYNFLIKHSNCSSHPLNVEFIYISNLLILVR